VLIVASESTGTRNYTISGVSSADINGASLTGTVNLVNGEGTFDIVLSEDISSSEGTETLTIVVEEPAGNIEASLTVYDTSTVLFITPTAVVGDIITVRLNTSNTPETNGTEIPYTISGNYITAVVLDRPLTGNFVVNNNIAEFTITIPSTVSTTLIVTAYGETASCVITFNPDITDEIIRIDNVIDAAAFSVSTLSGIPTPFSFIPGVTPIESTMAFIETDDYLDRTVIPFVTETTKFGTPDVFVVQPLGLPLVREYWI
jgi:hypothetical protein